jgi:hypothetical protein
MEVEIKNENMNKKRKGKIFWDVMLCVRWNFSNVSQQHIASIFRVEMQAKKVFSKKQEENKEGE